MATQIAAAEGLSGNELKERVAVLQNCSVKELTEKLQSLLNGSTKSKISPEEEGWGFLDVEFSKDCKTTDHQKPLRKETKTDGNYAEIVKEDPQITAIEKLRSDAYSGMELLNAQNDGFIGKSYDAVKEFIQSQFAKSAVSKVLYAQTVSADLMEQAKNGDLTKQEYLDSKRRLLYDTYPNIESTSENGKALIFERIETLSPKDLKTFQDMVLKLPNPQSPKYPSALREFEETFNEFTSKKETVKSYVDEQIFLSEKITSNEKFYPEPGTKNEKLKFEEVFEYEQGQEFAPVFIEDYSKKYIKFQLLSNMENRTAKLHELLDDKIKLVKGNTTFGVSDAAKIQSDEVLNNALFSAFSELYGNEENINAELKNNENWKNLEFKNGKLEYTKSPDSPFSMPMNSSALATVAEQYLEKHDNELKKQLQEKPISFYENELEVVYKFAYGDKNAKQLSQAYSNDQNASVQNVRRTAEYVGTGFMIGGMILYPPAAFAGAAVSSVGGVGIEIADELTKKDISSERLKELAIELGTNASFVAAGFYAGAAGNAVKTGLLAKNCPKLLAAAADIGTDATLSLISDLMLTGQISLEAEGFSQIMSLVAGHVTKVKTPKLSEHPITTHHKKEDFKLYNTLKNVKDSSGKEIFNNFTIRKILDAYPSESAPKLNELYKKISQKYPNPEEAAELFKMAAYNPVLGKTQDFDFALKALNEGKGFAEVKEIFSGLNEELYTLQKDYDESFQTFTKLNPDPVAANLMKLLKNKLTPENMPALKKAIADTNNGAPIITVDNIYSFINYKYKFYESPNLTKAQKIALINSSDAIRADKLLNALENGDNDTKNKIREVLSSINEQKPRLDKKDVSELYYAQIQFIKMQAESAIPETIRTKLKNASISYDRFEHVGFEDLDEVCKEISKISDPNLKEIAVKELEKEVDSALDIIQRLGYSIQVNYTNIDALINMDKAFNGSAKAQGDVLEYYEYLRKEYPDKALRFEQLLEKSPQSKSMLQKFKEKITGANALESFDEELEPILRDFKHDKKFEPMKKWTAENSKGSPETVNRVYENYYLSKLPAHSAQMCRTINKDFGTKVFLGDYNNTEVLQYLYNELFEWKKAGGNKAVFPPVIDLTKIKQNYIRKPSSAAGFLVNSTKSIYVDGDNINQIKSTIRHEIMHANDAYLDVYDGVLNEVDIDEIIVRKAEVDENGDKLVDFTKCKYIDELKEGLNAAGINSSHAYYGYSDKAELLAVASEGDFSKYSPEFKETLIKLGMPKWVLKMENHNRIGSAKQVYAHKDYSPKYTEKQNADISASARKQYNDAVNSYTGVLADFEKFYSITGTKLNSRVKTFEGIFEKHYRNLEKYDKMTQKAYDSANPQIAKNKGTTPISNEELKKELKRIETLKTEALNDLTIVRNKIEDSIGGRLVMDDSSPEMIERVFQNTLKAIDSGEVKLTTMNNYCGKGMQPYFTPKQIEEIYKHCKAQGYEPYIVSPIDTKNTTLKTDYDFHPEEAEKPSGYTTAQMNFEHKNGFVSEFQIRGRAINELAESEHIIYDIREGKDITKGDPEIAALTNDIKTLILEMDKPQNAKLKSDYSDYLTECYEYARKSELGQFAKKPVLKEGFDPKLSIDNIINIHNQLSIISKKIK